MMVAKRDLRGFLEQMLVRFYTGLPEAFWPVGRRSLSAPSRGVLRRKERGFSKDGFDYDVS